MTTSKIRTLEMLDRSLNDDFVRRRAEILHLKTRLENKQILQTEQDALLRSCLIVLYAHWEGFIKESATAYICFVAMQKLKYSQLAPNFVAIGINTLLNSATQSKSPRIRNDLAKFFIDGLDSRSQILWDGIVNTQSNLSSEVFHDIIDLLGLEYLSDYETKSKMINFQLLRNRHMAAHGELYLDIDIEGFSQLYYNFVGGRETEGLMPLFKNQVINAASLKIYLR